VGSIYERVAGGTLSSEPFIPHTNKRVSLAPYSFPCMAAARSSLLPLFDAFIGSIPPALHPPCDSSSKSSPSWIQRIKAL
jgi:hypothetical protein